MTESRYFLKLCQNPKVQPDFMMFPCTELGKYNASILVAAGSIRVLSRLNCGDQSTRRQ